MSGVLSYAPIDLNGKINNLRSDILDQKIDFRLKKDTLNSDSATYISTINVNLNGLATEINTKSNYLFQQANDKFSKVNSALNSTNQGLRDDQANINNLQTILNQHSGQF